MPSEVQILKESKARFEGVIFNQTADLGTNKSTSCKVIDEATGNVICEAGEGGGGGESDFTTAEVTITNSTASTITQSCINVLEIMGEQAMTSELPPISANQSRTCDMVLFKGSQVIYAPDDVVIAVTGDIEEIEGMITITGDGTITYTAK